jgi:type 1 fimbriae regulatory protein FimE
VSRLKQGFSTVHPLMPDERRALEALRVRDLAKPILPEIVFISTRGTPLSRQQAWRIVRNSGERSGLNTATHPHMLRHACGYELAERGTDTRLIQDYLGHRNMPHGPLYGQQCCAFYRIMGARKPS